MRTRNALFNLGSQLVFTAVTITVGLFASPRLMHWLGAGRFGAFRVILDSQGYLTLLELGLGGALAPLLARSLATGDGPALRQTMAAAAQAYLRVALAAVVVGACLTGVVTRLVAGLSPADLADLRGAWWVGLLGFLSMGLTPFRSMLEARQLGHRVNLLLTGQAVLITAISLLLARAGWGITGQSLAFVIGIWACALTWSVAVLRRDGALIGSWTLATLPETRRVLWSLSAATFLITLSNRVSLMTDNLVVGSMLGAGMVTTLFFSQRLAVLAQSLLLGIGSATWAPLAELHARGEHEAFNRRLVELSRLVAILSIAGLGPIVAYNHHFVVLWLGASFPYAGDAVIILAACNAFLVAQVSLWGWCFSATGQTHRVVASSVASALVNAAASLALTRSLGLVGPLLGTTIGFFAVSLWSLPWLLRRVFGTAPAELAGAVLAPLAGGLLYSSALWWIAHHHRPPGWPGLACEMALAALSFLALAGGAVLLKADERHAWRLRMRSVLARG